MRKSGVDFYDTIRGAHGHNLISFFFGTGGDYFDSPADQRAIFRGYHYNKYIPSPPTKFANSIILPTYNLNNPMN
ncbi:hypothetical protein EI427_04825 [Flammeovirga pectinis]|uniref:Uncharacterized protein n=1 Tax=Flammeovirga pectinis TaxID=2494373 RepID=A0A3Q9FJJ8_9BACT|nr:hypothetical protein [Flammeovirga pectinis]AZQ61575.1 hypothetical protein EI427_04825 [Flammeovirga pectinis]